MKLVLKNLIADISESMQWNEDGTKGFFDNFQTWSFETRWVCQVKLPTWAILQASDPKYAVSWFYIVSSVTFSIIFLLAHHDICCCAAFHSFFFTAFYVLHCCYTPFQKVRLRTEQKKYVCYYLAKKPIIRR